MQSTLPEYVIPNYSGQGAAVKINSNTKFQYIELARSPILFNKTFTISIWIKPEMDLSKMYNLMSQTYVAAPSLTMSIIDQSFSVSIYGTQLRSPIKLKNSEWQYVTFTFDRENLSMTIYIDGVLSVYDTIQYPEYGNFEIQRTTIGGYDAFNQYSGSMDHLAIAFVLKNNIDILDEATLVAHYDFEGDDKKHDFLFNDISANSIQAQGSNVSYLTGNRYPGRNTLLLYNPNLSYFQSGGFPLLSTRNYSYSYALWLNVSSISSFIPLVHLVNKYEPTWYQSAVENCLTMLGVNRTGTVEFF